MKLKKIKLENYRNIISTEAEFCDGLNIITGNNAQGKTNTLEAIYLFARGRAFRARKDEEIIRFGQKSTYCEIQYENEDGKTEDITYRIVKNEGKKYTLNGFEVKKLSELIGNFRAVLFSPDSLSLVKASPGERRLFADIAISQLTPSYVQYLKKYNHILSQRNTLLRDGYGNVEMYETFAEQMAPYAYEISKIRYDYIESVKKYVEKYFAEMSTEKEKAGVRYCSSLQTDYSDKKESIDLFYRLFTENIQRELQYKTTLYGISRDDIELMLNSKPAKLYCSQGQIRSLALSLKLAEGHVAEDKSGVMPVYMLDDVFGELDESRREFLSKELDGVQVIITCCDTSNIKSFDKAKIFKMEDGKLTE